MDPYGGRMRAMLIFAFCPLVISTCSAIGPYFCVGTGNSYRYSCHGTPIVVGQHFFYRERYVPKYAVATITGIGGMAGGLGSFLINKGSGVLFDYSIASNMRFLGFEGLMQDISLFSAFVP
jgi:ACS family hexuronate transporter-like MFS transporter